MQGARTYYADTSVAKSTVRLGVAIVDLVLCVILSAVVVGKLDQPLTVPDGVAMGQGVWRVVAQEVQVKLVVRELELLDDRHAKVFVEFDRGFGVLDSDPSGDDQMFSRHTRLKHGMA
jgi:hypothetical protein